MGIFGLKVSQERKCFYFTCELVKQNVREYKKEYHKDNNKIKVNRKLQVLIVEDDEVNQMVLSKAIKEKDIWLVLPIMELKR